MIDGGKKVEMHKRRYESVQLEYSEVSTAYENVERKMIRAKNRYNSLWQRSSAKRDEEFKIFDQRVLNKMMANIVAFTMKGTPLPDVDELFVDEPSPSPFNQSIEPLFKAMKAAEDQISIMEELLKNSNEPLSYQNSIDPATKAMEGVADLIEEFVNKEEFVNNSNQPDVVELSPSNQQQHE